MDEDLKTRFLFFAALFMTMLIVFQMMGPEPDETTDQTTEETDPLAASAAASGTSTTSSGTSNPTTDSAVNTAESNENGDTTAPHIGWITVETPHYIASFTSRGGALRSIVLKDYYTTVKEKRQDGEHLTLLDEVASGMHALVIERLGGQYLRTLDYEIINLPENASVPNHDLQPGFGNELIFRAVRDQWEIIKTFTFAPVRAPDATATELQNPYGSFTINLTIRDLSGAARPVEYSLIGPAGIVPDDISRFGPTRAQTAYLEEDAVYTEYIDTASLRSSEHSIQEVNIANIIWSATKNRFFGAALRVDNPETIRKTIHHAYDINAAYAANDPRMAEIIEVHPASAETIFHIVAPAAAETTHTFAFYAGPLEEEPTAAFDPRLPNIIYYGWSWFEGISRFLSHVLHFLSDLVGNYGIAIIILTLIVKTIMHPLVRKQMTSMHKMQKIAPEVSALKEKYGDDRQRMSQEMMRIYAENGVNPIGGCLPMFIQIPIFISLYGTFAYGFGGRHTPFLGWINDLSQPDSLLTWDFDIMLISWFTQNSLNILPIIYLILQTIHISMQPKAQDEKQQQMQQMMRIMPIMFAVIFYTMPSGLVLYFTIQSVYTLTEHYLIKRNFDTPDASASATASTATGKVTAPAGAGVGVGKGGGKKKKKKK